MKSEIKMHGKVSMNRRFIKLPYILATLITSLLYFEILKEMVIDWWTNPAFSYGFVVPPAVFFFLWQRRKNLSSKPAPDPRGLFLVLAACGLLLAATVGSEYFLMRFSLIPLLAGLVWTFAGFAWLRVLAVPLLLLATMIPLPQLVLNRAAIPLQLLSSEISVVLLRWLGATVHVQGNILHLPGLTLGVAEACSGLHSLVSLIVLSLLVGYAQFDRPATRLSLLVLAVPVALAANVIRITFTVLIARYHEAFALGFYHSFSGWLVFMGGAAILLMLASQFQGRLEGRAS
jgi:exosortase